MKWFYIGLANFSMALWLIYSWCTNGPNNLLTFALGVWLAISSIPVAYFTYPKRARLKP